MKETKEIIITKAEDLPIETRNKFNVYQGFVEVRLETNSPVEPIVSSLKEAPGSHLRNVLKEAGFSQDNFK